MISEKEFRAYEAVRKSGVTNMFLINVVSDLSGLSREKILEIIQNYEVLLDKYPNVRKISP